MVRRLVVLAAFAGAIVLASAAPAFAHASLLSTEPQPGGVFQKTPPAVSLRFSESVEVSLGDIRVFDGTRARVDVGAPKHPAGLGNQIRVALPNLKNGSYVVTWRVISADSHPVEGAFTFQVGPKRTVRNPSGVAQDLLASSSGSTAVGAIYGVDRALVFASLAVLIGGVAFLAFLFPDLRGNRRARRIVWAGYWATALTTIAAVAIDGAYAAALPLSKVFDPSAFRDVLDTRFGKLALIRLGLLVLAFPLVRILVGSARRLRATWVIPAVLIGGGLASTPGLAGHASTGIHTAWAVPADTIHVAAMACWLGGLLMVATVVLPRRDPDELRYVLPRFSAVGLATIAALVVTGGFQAWRQVGSLDALRNTSYGNILVVKLVVFAALIVAAAYSREIVNRRFRAYPDDPTSEQAVEPTSVAVPVGIGAGGPSLPLVGDGPVDHIDHIDHIARPIGEEHGEYEDDDNDNETEIRRLRRSVGVEVLIAVVVLAVNAILVNAAPARTVTTSPVSLTLKSSKLWVDVTIAPGVAGANDVHVTALPTAGGFTTIQDMQVQLTKDGEDLPPFTLPLRKLGPGHYYAPLFDVPYPGQWQLIARVQLTATDQVVLTGRFSLR